MQSPKSIFYFFNGIYVAHDQNVSFEVNYYVFLPNVDLINISTVAFSNNEREANWVFWFRTYIFIFPE